MPLINAGQRVTASSLASTYTAADIGAVTVTAAVMTDLTGTFTIPANDAVVGNMYEIEAWGNGSQGSTQQRLLWQVVLGGVAMTSPSIGSTYMAASQNFRWKAQARVICLSTGSTGTWQSSLELFLSVFGGDWSSGPGGSSTSETSAGISCESSGTTTLDTTVAQGLKIQCSWAATTGAPTITKRIAFQRKLGVG